MKKNHAFTLIELLVVIAIIAVLVALLAPSLAKFMERGRATDDANNLANMGKAMQQFINDSHGTMFSMDAQETWPKAMHKNYLQDWKVFRSPFDKVTSARPKREDDPVPISYGMNENIFDTFEGRWKAPTSTLILMAPAVDASAPGKEAKFMDSAVSTNNVTIRALGSSAAGNTSGFGTHSNRELINVLFADSHVEAMEWKKYVDSGTERGQEQWKPDYERPSSN
jgi:prepilin-type N-terminal cleavage/methylation domain-containing protein/prepilin-type processing-associated H-X9-DG protein